MGGVFNMRFYWVQFWMRNLELGSFVTAVGSGG